MTPTITALAIQGPRLSVTSKLDGIRSWSLQALDTCPGSIESPGVLVDACKGCYATTGNYVFANVRAPREFNRTDWERFAWVDDMVNELARDTHFRWFDSGDVYSLALAEKILDVMTRTPWVKHWLPTRMHKFPKFALVLQAMQALPNVMVRPSSDSIVGVYTPGLHGSVIVPDSRVDPSMVTLCRAYEHEGKCNGCRACYDKAVPVIAYPAHGARMNKVIRLKQL
jgi:hypothetical protein